MSGTYADLHFIAKLRNDGSYYCIPQYSGGNGTKMDFFATSSKAQFFDSLEEAIGSKIKHNNRLKALREERQLTGYHRREY